MFNTDTIYFLQQFDHPIIYWFMVAISALGTTPVIMTLVLAITFGVDYKKGLVLVNIIGWVAILTFLLKSQIDFPRPVDVDGSLKTVYFEQTDNDLNDLQPQSFLESFSPELLKQTRNDEFDRFGFPSGHSSIQFALWITLYFLFRKRKILLVGLFMTFSTMLSRLYLAHHYLADVLGGALLGITISLLLIFLVKKTAYLKVISQQFKSLSILWIPIFLTPLASLTPIWIFGSLLGLNAASILLILRRNFPVFHALTWKRVTSMLIALILIFSIYFLVGFLEPINKAGIELLLVALFSIGAILGSMSLSNRLNLIRFRF